MTVSALQALGNHEFDRGIDGLLEFLQNSTFNILSCNIDTTKEPRIAPYIAPHHVALIDSEKVGIIGYTTIDTPIISNPGTMYMYISLSF